MCSTALIGTFTCQCVPSPSPYSPDASGTTANEASHSSDGPQTGEESGDPEQTATESEATSSSEGPTHTQEGEHTDAGDTNIPAACGDGELDDGERCDEGENNGQAGACNPTCQFICDGPCPWFVDAAQRSAADETQGRDWGSAFSDIQAAIDRAGPGEPIFVRHGHYASKDNDEHLPLLRLRTGVQLYGGFMGQESTLAERGDPRERPTVLDGAARLSTLMMSADDTIVDGFRFENARATTPPTVLGDPKSVGAGILVARAQNVQIRDCDFISNTAIQGSGIYVYLSHGVEITNSNFVDNKTTDGYVGIASIQSEDVAIEGCRFSGNIATEELGRGGAIGIDDSTVHIRGSRFEGNVVGDYGGAVFLRGASLPTIDSALHIESCEFEANAAGGYGGGVFFGDHSTFSVHTSWFEANHGQRGGGALATTGFGDTDGIVTDSTFIENMTSMDARSRGGALAVAGRAELVNNRFFRNHAEYNGGAISMRGNGGGQLLAVNNLFVENTVEKGEGAVFSSKIDEDESPDLLTFVNATLVGNDNASSSSLFENTHPDSVLVNLVLLGPDMLVVGDHPDIWTNKNNSCLLGAAGVDQYFDVEPDGLELAHYYLRPDNPCLGIGDSDFADDLPASVDFDWRQLTTLRSGVLDGEDQRLDAGYHTEPQPDRPQSHQR